MRRARLLLVWVALGAGALPVAAQLLEVTNAPPITPQNLITNIFLGEGVEVLNVTYQGSNNAVGFFKNGQNAVGMERGIVMTTGRAVTQGFSFGVAEPGNVQASVDNFSTAMDPDMQAIAGGAPIFNVAKYTITFIPIADTLRFRYAFASEEYPEFVCSEFNDIFGFFISGPGINGPYENNAINIARIPGTDLPVTINNVNSGLVGASGILENCMPPLGSLAYGQYYNNNEGSGNMPVYDGITDVFTAEAVVQPCQVYTIKLVICDVSDAVYDSGVFLEAKSFGTGSLNVDVATLSLDGSVAEGCASGRITFSLPNPVESNYYIDYRLLGSAVNGIDYERLPDSIFIPAGQTSVSMDIVALEDGLPEGTETLLIDVQRDACNRDTFLIAIRDNPLIKPDLGRDTVVCAGSPVQLDGTVPIALPPLPSFSNTNNTVIQPTNVPVFSNINVVGVAPNTLGPAVLRSVCLDSISHPWIDDLDIFLITPGGRFLELTTDNGGNGGNGLGMDHYIGTCFTPDAAVRINFPGPFAPPSAVPFTGEWLPEGEWNDIWGGPVNGQWRLQLIDDTNGATGTLHSWTITFNRIYDIGYQWSPATGLTCSDCPNPTARAQQSREYILTATDSYGCTTADTIFIEAVPRLPAPAPVCGAATDNSVALVWQAVAGATGYEVNVNNSGWTTPSGALEHVIAGLGSGQEVDFSVRALGLCPGFFASIRCRALSCSPPELTASTTDASCDGVADGAVVLASSNASGMPVFELNGVLNNDGVFTNLAPGLYLASLTDNSGCPATVQFTINAPQALILDPVLLDSINCNGGNNGAAFVTVFGGRAPYSYAWSNGSGASSATGLSAGLYTVTVTDQPGCTAEAQIRLAEPPPLSLSILESPVSCHSAADGALTAMPAGGTAPYTFLWDSAAGNRTTARADGLGGGVFQVLVTDARGCLAQAGATVPEAPPVQLLVLPEDARCFGEASGAAVAGASGGSGGFSFAWSNGQTGAAIAGLTAGHYTVTATDAAGCRDSAVIHVGQPLQALVVQWQITDPSCSGASNGAALASIQGGTPGYTIAWAGQPPGIDPLRQNLAAGIYAVTVTDANNCSAAGSIAVSDPPVLSVSLGVADALCNGAADGAATASPAGGTGGYAFLWSNGQTNAAAVDLAGGPVSVTVTDANGCVASGSTTIGEPAALAAVVNIRRPRCSNTEDGEVSVAVNGGTMPYAYQWNNLPGHTTASIGGLVPGTYSVVVTDANGCTLGAEAQIDAPPALTLQLQSTPVRCHAGSDGAIFATAGGGTGALSYTWSTAGVGNASLAANLPAGLYSLTVTDEQNCRVSAQAEVVQPLPLALSAAPQHIACAGNASGRINLSVSGGIPPYRYTWSNGATVEDPDQLPAGDYHVTVTDANDCSAGLSVAVVQTTPLRAVFQTTPVDCYGSASGAATVSVAGGAAPYALVWSNGSTGPSVRDVVAGEYDLIVTDSLGCRTGFSVTIPQPAEPLAAGAQLLAPSCHGEDNGRIELEPRGGTPPYRFSLDGQNFTPNRIFISLSAGIYRASIQDANGCAFQTGEIALPEPPPLRVDLGPDITIAYGDSLLLNPIVSGAAEPALFEWKPRDSLFFSCLYCPNPVIRPLFQRAITLVVTDANGCSAEDLMTVFVRKDPRAFVPTGFTPNGDGNNDRLLVHGRAGTRVLSFRVFDRWGQLLHESGDFEVNDVLSGWDGTFRGKPVESGAYIWSLTVELPGGDRETLAGESTLIR